MKMSPRNISPRNISQRTARTGRSNTRRTGAVAATWRFVVGMALVIVAVIVLTEILIQPTSTAQRMEYVRVLLLPVGLALIVTPLLGRWVAKRSSIAVGVMAVAVGSIAFGAVASTAAAGAMFIDKADIRPFFVVLMLSSGISLVVGMQLTAPLVANLEQLGRVADTVATGDLTVQTGIHRNDELGRTAAAIDDMIVALRDAERERERVDASRQLLFSSISHDLRTPLAAMRARIESLQDGMEPDPQRAYALLDIEVQNAAALIEQLSTFARIADDASPVIAETVSVSEIAHEAVEALTPMAQARGIDLRFEASAAAKVGANPLDIARVIRNLITNAIDYARTQVEVAVVAAPHSVRLSVCDDGDGFPADFRDEAFDPGTRADTARSDRSGHAGLGLAITRSLVTKHGGRVWIADADGGRVDVELPSRDG